MSDSYSLYLHQKALIAIRDVIMKRHDLPGISPKTDAIQDILAQMGLINETTLKDLQGDDYWDNRQHEMHRERVGIKVAMFIMQDMIR